MERLHCQRPDGKKAGSTGQRTETTDKYGAATAPLGCFTGKKERKKEQEKKGTF